MSSKKSKKTKTGSQTISPKENMILTQRFHGIVAGIKWGKSVPNNLLSYAYFKLRVEERRRDGVHVIGFFLDLHLMNCPQGEQGDELRAYLDDADRDVRDETIAWLYGWLLGIELLKVNPGQAEELLREYPDK